MKYPEFLRIALVLNRRLQITPLLFGSLGLEQRLNTSLKFNRHGIHIAFAGIENLKLFAGIDISGIPVISENGASFYLLELSDYLKVYTASSKDGYRKNVKNKQDQNKIEIIKQALKNGR